ncbi:MAG: eukaryotic-like serine/threonine-protein kinase [Acidobacteriota bacterium]|jgi:serine/threonine protein kinase/Tfp pilus assembly protein PilF|nr:eukaryotic-like serine/threonine-protein kinase [Acidobacteriota bacterium]
MRTEDWLRVEELFHAALLLSGAERADYLARECDGDERLRTEVESLVAASESERSFIELPALTLGMRVLTEGLAGSLVGSSIGHYKVVRLLGRGGMGEVYLAEDSVLERPVALKFISGGLVGGEWAHEQLMQEARAVARLEDSNICAVYGVEETDSHNFIVMQYVEGDTLAALLGAGRLELERALDLAEQIVSALASAHARGVIHHDVKPQNIIVTKAGQVKVLDFGLAKFVRPRQQDADARAPEETSHNGVVIGTVAYMSPEQTRGEELDGRSDLFSFGIVLYEMLAGRNPFLRETDEEIINAIKEDEAPPLEDLPPRSPRTLAPLVRKCLAKQSALRYETADELLRDLRAASAATRDDETNALRARLALKRRRRMRLASAALALVLLLSACAGFIYMKLSSVHTLAVLPIANASEDREADYLSEGLTRNLSAKFSYLPRLRVRLPSAVPPGRGERADLARIGRELQADAVLAGQVFKRGNSLQLHLSLLNASDASQIWDGTFNLDGADTLALQNEITSAVSSRIGLWLLGDERKLLAKRQTDNEEAMRLYMRGQHLLSLQRTQDNVRTAIGLFERAFNLDPSFAQAYTGLADAYVLLTTVAYGPVRTKDAMEKANWAARKALESDDTLPEAHTSMGNIKLNEWEWQEAEQEFRRALVLDPGYAPAHRAYSNLLAALGRYDEAVREADAGKKLDPYSPISAMNYGRALYYARRSDEAAAHFRALLAENPDYAPYLHMMGLVLLQQGRVDEAIVVLEKLHSMNPLYAAPLGYAYGKAGRPDAALAMIREINELSKTKPMPPLEEALVRIGMSDRDEAFAKLEAAYQERLALLAYLTTDSLYDDLRPDPRFADLARRVNLTP